MTRFGLLRKLGVGLVATTSFVLPFLNPMSFAHAAPAAVAPTVMLVTPSSSPVGAVINVVGSGFTGATSVSFGTASTPFLSVAGSTSIYVYVPPGTGTVDVTVTTPSGTSANSSADKFTYGAAPAPPRVTGVTPSPATIGGIVNVTGSGFTGATSVNFGYSSTPYFGVASDSSIYVYVPPGTGTVDVTVTTGPITSAVNPSDKFSYASATAPPTVTSVSPAVGTAASIAELIGTGFSGATSVSFGAQATPFFGVNSDTTIYVFVPPGTGTVPVAVTTPMGTSTSAGANFTYQSNQVLPPTITSVSPASGPPSGGTMVTIAGSNLSDVTSADFGSTPVTATSIMNMSSTEVMLVSPVGTASDTVGITVTTAGGTSTVSSADANQFSYTSSTTAQIGNPLVTDCASVGPQCSTSPTSEPGTTANPNINVFNGADPVPGYSPQGTAATESWGPITVPAATSSAMGMVNDAADNSVAMPCTNCYITSIIPDLTYTNGQEAGLASGAWFHHIALFDTAKTDPTCPTGLWNFIGVSGERFFAAGNERTQLLFPPGYGYYVGSADTWDAVIMLMNMNMAAINVDISMKFTWVAAPAQITPVKPVWLDVDQCGTSEVNLPNSNYNELNYTWTVNVPGQLLGMAGHIHNGGVNIYAEDNTQNNLLLCNSVASYSPTPSMSGSMYMQGVGDSTITSMSGCFGDAVGLPPVATLNSGDQVSLHAIYYPPSDPGADIDGVMGIMLTYIVPSGATPGSTGS